MKSVFKNRWISTATFNTISNAKALTAGTIILRHRQM